MSAQKIVLRCGTVEDASQSLELFRAVVEEELFFMVSTEECARTLHAQETHIRHHVLDRDSCIFVALSGERLVGQISVRAGSYVRVRHVGTIEMFVDKEYRGCGMGSQLLKQALDWSKRNTSLRKIALSVFADNRSAIALYTKFGFTEEGRIHGAFREVDNRLRDNILMGLWM
jgi:RimJ/RimL family protein N-acetyltransferase